MTGKYFFAPQRVKGEACRAVSPAFHRAHLPSVTILDDCKTPVATPVILSEAKNPILGTETLRFAQDDKIEFCNRLHNPLERGQKAGKVIQFKPGAK